MRQTAVNTVRVLGLLVVAGALAALSTGCGEDLLGLDALRIPCDCSRGDPGKTPLSIEIVSPFRLTAFDDEFVTFDADVVNPGNRTLSAVWSSDLDGTFGEGFYVYTDALSVGVHRITLTVTDPDGRSASDEVLLEISVNPDPEAPFEPPPVYEILTPSSLRSGEQGYAPGQTIVLHGRGTRYRDQIATPVAPDELLWYVDGEFVGAGELVTTERTAPGEHLVVLRGPGDHAFPPGSSSTFLFVVSDAPGDGPTGVILTPAPGEEIYAFDEDGATYYQDRALTARAFDSDGNELGDDAVTFEWRVAAETGPAVTYRGRTFEARFAVSSSADVMSAAYSIELTVRDGQGREDRLVAPVTVWQPQYIPMP